MHDDGDFQVAVAGTETTTNHPKVWATRFGDGFALGAGTWGSLRTITNATAGSLIAYSRPAVRLHDGLWRLFYIESFTGDAAYERLQYTTKPATFDFDVEQWREAVAFDYAGNSFGLSACALSGTRLALVASDGVWSGERLVDLDVSGDVVEAAVDCDTDGSRARIELDNSAGRYTGYGASDVDVVQRGARVELAAGYVTSTGNGVHGSNAYAYTIESIEVGGGARPRVVLHCRGGDWLMQRWRARRQYVFAAGSSSVAGILFVLASRAGLPSTGVGNSSDAFDNLQPAFTVHPGESGLTAVRRLIAKVGDVLWFDGGALLATDPRADDPPLYAFGPGQHEIVEARYLDLGPAINRARTLGDDVYGEAFDFAELEAFGEAIGDAADENLDTAAKAQARSQALLRKARIPARRDELTLFGVHCAIELWDAVEVTDPRGRP